MTNKLTRIAATATMVLALSAPAYAADCCPKPIRTAITGIGQFFSDANAKAWENSLVRMGERNERRLDRTERTLLNAQYRHMDNVYHRECIPHYHQCQHNNATVTMPVPFGYEVTHERMFPPKEALESSYQQPTLAPQEIQGPTIILAPRDQ